MLSGSALRASSQCGDQITWFHYEGKVPVSHNRSAVHATESLIGPALHHGLSAIEVLRYHESATACTGHGDFLLEGSEARAHWVDEVEPTLPGGFSNCRATGTDRGEKEKF